MSVISSMGVSASGLSAERLRMDTIANNLANANTAATERGEPFRRQMVIFQARKEGGVRAAGIAEDQAPFRMQQIPGHPMADANGWVRMPNVNVVNEMVDLISASRSYEANITAFNAAKTMTQRALDIGRV